jgi:hypothetical protein
MHATFAGSKLPSLNSPPFSHGSISIIAHMGPLKKGLVCNSGFDFSFPLSKVEEAGFQSQLRERVERGRERERSP